MAIGLFSLAPGNFYSMGLHPLSGLPLGEGLVIAFFGVVAVSGGGWLVGVDPFAAHTLATGQMIGLPAAAVLMQVAASPGGVTSNCAALLARGSVGLSVAMTFITSLADPITLPLVFLVASVSIPGAAGLWKISLAMVAVALVPILLGAIAARVAPDVSARVSRRLDPVARLLFLAIVLATFGQNRDATGRDFSDIGGAVTLFVVLTPIPAFLAGRVVGIRADERRTFMWRRRCRTWA